MGRLQDQLDAERRAEFDAWQQQRRAAQSPLVLEYLQQMQQRNRTLQQQQTTAPGMSLQEQIGQIEHALPALVILEKKALVRRAAGFPAQDGDVEAIESAQNARAQLQHLRALLDAMPDENGRDMDAIIRQNRHNAEMYAYNQRQNTIAGQQLIQNNQPATHADNEALLEEIRLLRAELLKRDSS